MTEVIDLVSTPEPTLRRSKINKQRPSRRRGDRIAPEGMSTKDASLQSRKRVNGKGLKIETSSGKRGDEVDTPRTDASTPAGSVRSTPSVRSKSDIRSPGQRKTPAAATAEAPPPDFITQTDKDGNAVTPRSAAALRNAQKGGDKEEEDDLEVCAETLLDTFRLMCCCLVPEDAPVAEAKKSVPPTTVQSGVIEERPSTGILPKIVPADAGKQCLVLDLDETLVHSSFRAVPGADFVIPVQIEDVVHFVYVMKRPGVDEFLVEMAKHYEIVIYTASLNKYADPLLDLLDPRKTIRSRLFRESCVYYEGNYVKDLSILDRDLSQTIIVDNSPNSYIFHPENAIDCSSFIDDPKDRELDQIGAFLKGVKDVKDIRGIAPKWREWPNVPIQEQ